MLITPIGMAFNGDGAVWPWQADAEHVNAGQADIVCGCQVVQRCIQGDATPLSTTYDPIFAAMLAKHLIEAVGALLETGTTGRHDRVINLDTQGSFSA